MKYEKIKNSLKEIVMPEQMKKDLFEGCLSHSHTDNFRFRYSRQAAAAMTAAIALFVTGMPAYAAYDLYQTKNLSVFFEKGLEKEQIDELGEILSSMEGISSVRFIGADKAWESFAESYLTEELAASFHTNPLADSASYEVTVSLGSDTKKIRAEIERLEGVRRLADRYELKESETAAKQ